ncbi:MAG: DoxX family protein [Sphingobacteriales bacterium]|jgi:uncharacterized membrane protein YphA (DoxX/SURF4 family)|nr:MAG: DoxX family protein [Sphingobacteriales bacterium]
MKYITQIVRYLVGALFIFSGVVKAIDPAGTAIKMEEYFEVFATYVPKLEFLWHFFAQQALIIATIMIVLEIILGITLILGIWKKFTLGSLVAIIIFFTFLTWFSAKTGKVTDCGCFGDFIKLTPTQSYHKDLVLCVLILILVIGAKHIKQLFAARIGIVIFSVLAILTLLFTFRNIYYEPIKDFRPYTIGTSIPKCLELPPNAKKTITEMVFVYKNKQTGEVKRFNNTFPEDLDNWTFVDREDKVIQKGDEPKCKDFAIKDANGNDNSASFFEEEEYIFFIICPNIKKTSVSGFDKLLPVCKAAEKDNRYVFILSGSLLEEVESFKQKNKIPYEVYTTDETPLKTIMRSNPGLLILKKGKIVAKYHYNEVPDYQKIKKEILK